MAAIRGFQSNTTIHAAFWIYKPDASKDPTAKETLIEVNSIQRIEANSEVIMTNVASVQVTSNQLVITVGSTQQMRALQQQGSMAVLFRGLTNATFLNGQAVTITKILGPTSFQASFTNPDYPPTAEPAGAQILDTSNRSVSIYYPEGAVSTSQSPRRITGIEASYFLYDMEALFL